MHLLVSFAYSVAWFLSRAVPVVLSFVSLDNSSGWAHFCVGKQCSPRPREHTPLTDALLLRSCRERSTPSLFGHDMGADMDAKTSLGVLYTQSTYVCDLATTLCKTLQATEQQFSTPEQSTPPEFHDLMKRAAELKQLLATETAYFCQRLETVLQTSPFAAMVQADSPPPEER